MAWTTGSTGTFSASGSCTLSGGSCSVTYNPTVLDGHTITAAYSGDTAHSNGSGSASVTVTKRSTSTSAGCVDSEVMVGSSTSCSASTSDTSGTGATTPTGTIAWSSNNAGSSLSPASCELTSGACGTSYAPVAGSEGSHTLTAAYGGDATHLTSSGIATVTAVKRPSATSVTCTSPVAINALSSCVATVADNGAGTGATPTGTAQFSSAGTGTFPSGTSCTLASGECTVSYRPGAGSAGNHVVTAAYGGDADHDISSQTFQVAATRRSSSTSVSCVPSSIEPGQAATCTVTVADTEAGSDALAAAGGVTLASDGSGAFGGSCILASGTCEVTYTPALTAGATTAVITASFDGGTSHATSSGTSSLAVRDNTPPVLTGVPEDFTEEATSGRGAVVTFTPPTANDAVDGDVSVTCEPASDGTFAVGPTVVTCSASDRAGMRAEAKFTVTVADTTAPVLSNLQADITAEATSAAGAAVAYTAPTATDAVGVTEESCTVSSGSTFAFGSTDVTCSASDAALHTTSHTFKVSVVDTTPPQLQSVPGDITEEATSAAGAVVEYTAPTATDLVGVASNSCTPASGTTFAIGTTTVTCTALDAAGNKATASFEVKVRDTTAPEIKGTPGNLTEEAASAAGAVVTYNAPTAIDVVDPTVPVSCVPASGTTFALGVATVLCSAGDDSGNEASTSFTVTVQDKTAPALAGVPDSITMEATSKDGATATFGTPTASDVVDGTVPVTCVPPSGSTFPLGDPTTVKCSATDRAQNTGEAGFTVTVEDTTAPVLHDVPGNSSHEATSAAGAVVTFAAPTASDAVGVEAQGCLPASGATFAIADTTVTCSASDAAGNETSKTFTVTVTDTTAPELTNVPQDITEEATSAAGAMVTFSAPTATDAVGVVSQGCLPASGTTFAIGSTEVTCSASDTAKNTVTATFAVTVRDTTGPAITVPDDIAGVQLASATGTEVSFSASAVDLVDGTVPTTCSPLSGSKFLLGTTEVTCSARDALSNESSKAFKVTVVDTVGPALAKPADVRVQATSSAGAVVTYATPSATDLSGTASVECVKGSGQSFGLGSTTVSCTAIDGSGNTTVQDFAVTVAYGWSGVLQPVNADGSSVYKLGSTVPVKFKLNGVSAGINNATAKLYVAKISNGVVGTEAEATSTSAADSGNTFRYDAAGAQYIFNLGTKGLSEGSYSLRIDLGDGTANTVRISIKK